MKTKPIHKLKLINTWINEHIPLVFVIIALSMGTVITFRMHPIFGNDELVHFPRAFQVSEGHFWATHLSGDDYGGYEPVQIKQFNDAYREQVQIPTVDTVKLQAIEQQYSHERLNNDKREPLAFTSATLSAGWDYLPPAFGISVARLLHLPLNWFVYLARLSCLVTYVVLTYFAIKFIPIGKRFLLAVALLPSAVVQSVTIGMDGVVNGFSWLIIALAFAMLLKKVAVTPKILAIVTFLALFLATTKQGYMPIALLPLLLPARLFPFDLKRVWIWRLLFGGALLLASLWYLGATAHIAEIVHQGQRPGLYVNQGAQLLYIFKNPLTFLSMIFIQPFTIWSAAIYAGLIGVLTNKLVYLPIPLIVLLYGVCGITSLHKEPEHVGGRDRWYVLVYSIGVFLATFILINLALYLSFTRVGFDHVEGLQGRYFLALLPLLGIILHTAMPRLFLKISDTLTNVITYPILALGLITAAIVIH